MADNFSIDYSITRLPNYAITRLKILLNGEPFELDEPVTIASLLATLAIDARRVAVEHNLVVLKRALYDGTEVRDGDQVEIVNFVGGG